jgi:hypothetical protein
MPIYRQPRNQAVPPAVSKIADTVGAVAPDVAAPAAQPAIVEAAPPEPAQGAIDEMVADAAKLAAEPAAEPRVAIGEDNARIRVMKNELSTVTQLATGKYKLSNEAVLIVTPDGASVAAEASSSAEPVALTLPALVLLTNRQGDPFIAIALLPRSMAAQTEPPEDAGNGALLNEDAESADTREAV